MTKNLIAILAILTLSLSVLLPSNNVSAATTETRSIFFPTDPSVTFSDDFGSPRSGHLHIGIDMMGKKMMPLYSAIDGRVRNVVFPEASWGYEITLQDADGYTYDYIHVNNDTPGTDDDLGGAQYAYAPGIVRDATVTKGELVGWMGDSGDAENVGPHLHFEIHLPDGTAIDPYPSLIAARYPGSYSVADALAGSPNINVDKSLASSTGKAACVSGTLLKTATVSAVYYCGLDGKRHVFTNDKSYFTWYKDFSKIKIVTLAQFAAIPLGSNVTYRPGVKLIESQSGTRIYAVDKNGDLRWIKSETVAAALYGLNWKTKIDIIADAFMTNYAVGDPVLSARTP
jgi:murein DD-endopeptidase MepM/ murein hydrolase activator NlpD